MLTTPAVAPPVWHLQKTCFPTLRGVSAPARETHRTARNTKQHYLPLLASRSLQFPNWPHGGRLEFWPVSTVSRVVDIVAEVSAGQFDLQKAQPNCRALCLDRGGVSPFLAQTTADGRAGHRPDLAFYRPSRVGGRNCRTISRSPPQAALRGFLTSAVLTSICPCTQIRAGNTNGLTCPRVHVDSFSACRQTHTYCLRLCCAQQATTGCTRACRRVLIRCRD